MGTVIDSITAELQAFIEAQSVFFVASAPLSADGHVNLSPKGLDCLRVLSPSCVAYLDLTGSGNETAAHLSENGRITVIFCAFSGLPKIVRLYGTGTVVQPDTAQWAEAKGEDLPRYRRQKNARSIDGLPAPLNPVGTPDSETVTDLVCDVRASLTPIASASGSASLSCSPFAWPPTGA